MRKRRPQTYPAFLSEVHHILKELVEGAEFKRKNNTFYLCGYEVQLSNEICSFYRYDKVFLRLDFRTTYQRNINYIIQTPTWKFEILNDYKYLDTEVPLSKDDHFNLSTLHPDLPEWEDIEKINSILLYAAKLQVSTIHSHSRNFYP